MCSLCQRDYDGRGSSLVVPSRRRESWGDIGQGSFCSCGCLNRWCSGWIPVRCTICDYPFPGRITKRRPRRLRKNAFCSLSCKAIFGLRAKPCSLRTWQFLIHPSTRKQISEAIRERDQNTCQICGTRRSKDKILSADHIVPLLLAKEHDPVNLITLCEARCHRRKFEIESFLFEGDLVTFLTRLDKAGWPMKIVRRAMKRYGLPTTVSEIRRPARPKSLFLATRPSPIC